MAPQVRVAGWQAALAVGGRSGMMGIGKGEEMGKMEVKGFSVPDEVRTFEKGRVELVKMGGAAIGRAVFQSGWKWSTCVKPLAKTTSCQAPHFQYHVSGTLKVVMDDGTTRECRAGDVSLLPPGHDAWVVGNDPVVIVDFQGMADYAKQALPAASGRSQKVAAR